MKPTGQWLKAQRIKRGITLTSMASHMGYTSAYIWDLERGNRKFHPRLIAKYLKGLR